MKLFITGATGHIGTELISKISNQNYEINILVRKESNIRSLLKLNPKIKVFYSLEEVIEKNTIFSDADIFFHLATCYGTKNEDSEYIKYVNFDLGKKLLSNVLKFENKIFFNIDTSLPSEANYYSKYKKLFLSDSMRKINDKSINFINLTLENVYGPNDQDNKLIPSLLSACLENKEYFDLTIGKQKRDFIYIDDVISALIILLTEVKYDYRRNFLNIDIATSKKISIKELAVKIKKMTNSKTILRFGSNTKEIFDATIPNADTSFLFNLGWKPEVSIDSGLKKLINLF